MEIEWFDMSRYKTEKGVLVENWDLFYARDRDMVEFRMRREGNNVLVSVGDEVATLNINILENLKNVLVRWLK